MGITARLCPFTLSCVQRFRISGAKLGNHCKAMPVYALLCAAIPDFRGSIWESLQGYARLRSLACSDSGFQGVNLGIAARLCPFTTSCVQRFLISSPDLRIDASFTPETSFCVHRFLISSPDLRIDARFTPETFFCVHRFLISGTNLRIDACFSRFTPSCVQRLRISEGQFGNHCKVMPVYALLPAAIPDFMGSI